MRFMELVGYLAYELQLRLDKRSCWGRGGGGYVIHMLIYPCPRTQQVKLRWKQGYEVITAGH